MATDAPAVGIGHLWLTVADVARSCRFYLDLGLTPVHEDAETGILELRGGTHLLLFRQGAGPPGPAGPQRVDLMIAGRALADLEAFRDGLAARGIAPGPIPNQDFYGHRLFEVADPDGNTVVVATSHTATTEA
jgi:catechol 2,3-dioxygenase-like lactoylglutathione lyase family enzyme